MGIATSNSLCISTAETILDLNKDCHCLPIERDLVVQNIVKASKIETMPELLAERENYFASTAVFVSPTQLSAMQVQISAIETVARHEEFQNMAFDRQSSLAYQIQPKTQGAFMGYDFHMTDDGPRLIEVNSNAGGAFIVEALMQAIDLGDPNIIAVFIDMFQSEWRLAGRNTPLRTIAIVDQNPQKQFHYPDVLLAAEMFAAHNIEAIIVDSQSLSIRDSQLMAKGKIIDLIYNRSTDFMLESSDNLILQKAFMDDIAVVTPAPRHHALFADKRNLAILSDPKQVREFGLTTSQIEALSLIPKTIEVHPDNHDELWKNRRQYFFKPKDGFGSRAAYRGAKLTKKVWAHITQGNYVAQEFITPPLRAIGSSLEGTQLKFDVRVYTYKGVPLLHMARVYQGQTTNLRTKGGGLAVILPIDYSDGRCTKIN